jgi:hypothetical protein
MTETEQRIQEIKERIKSASEVTYKVFIEYIDKDTLAQHYFQDTKALFERIEKLEADFGFYKKEAEKFLLTAQRATEAKIKFQKALKLCREQRDSLNYRDMVSSDMDEEINKILEGNK